VPVQILLAVIVPALFGAICGWLLGVNKTAYLVLSILALLGGYAAGTEHKGAGGGALRGLLGGTLFGGAILLVNEALDKTPKADLPDPKILLLAITIGVGVVLGAMGGRARAGYDEDTKKEPGPPFDIRRVQRSEIIGFIGAGILFLSLFLNWFATSCDKSGNPSGLQPELRVARRQGQLQRLRHLRHPGLAPGGGLRGAVHPRLHHRPRPRSDLAPR